MEDLIFLYSAFFIFSEGHQKKLMLAVKRLAEMQRSSEGRSSLKKKPPTITQPQQDVMSMDSPPPDGKTSDQLRNDQGEFTHTHCGVKKRVFKWFLLFPQTSCLRR